MVEGEFDDGHSEDLTSRAEASCQIQGGDLGIGECPGTSGRAGHNESEVGGLNATPKCRFKASTPMAWSFRNQVLPVMTKVGCNSGACHGAAAGKNGFKLTLRGYTPDPDTTP